MKRIVIAGIIVGFMMFGSSVLAKKELGDLAAPTGLSYSVGNPSVCFEWVGVEGAEKYSVDIEWPIDADGTGVPDFTVELSFDTGDRTDELDMSDPSLCVPLDQFVYEFDMNGNGMIDEYEHNFPLTGTGYAKVKALDPHGGGRQNNAFSSPEIAIQLQ